jgi:peptidyl-prolyl cis-trans isomerase SurA
MQMTEFRDGNLFFEIMQQEIWNKAQNDSTALLALFEKNKNKYRWEKAADAVIFFCGDESVAKELQAAVKKNPSNWKSLLEQYAEKVIADSSRYEWFQLPLAQGVTPVAGMVTPPLVNTNDNSASFSYIFKVYTSPMPRNFSEAKGLVINDYQEELEKQWIERLKKKYPVTVNEKVLNEISK